MVTTITTITTVTIVTTLGISVFITVAATITLIILLTSKELAGTSSTRLIERCVRYASMGILPLVIVFGITVIIKVLEII